VQMQVNNAVSLQVVNALIEENHSITIVYKSTLPRHRKPVHRPKRISRNFGTIAETLERA
jgi:hypothetical protein